MTNNLVLVAPERGTVVGPSVFLAGGITNSPRWQDAAIAAFAIATSGITVFNPRRASDFGDDVVAYEQQVTWELDHLLAADVALFWFPRAECRITRIELGLVAGSGKPFIVGADPQFINYRYLALLAERLGQPLYSDLDALFAATVAQLNH